MDKNQEERLLSQLSSSERHVIEKFPDETRWKILEKISNGFKISEYNYSEVEVVKGFSYYNIERSGRMYAV